MPEEMTLKLNIDSSELSRELKASGNELGKELNGSKEKSGGLMPDMDMGAIGGGMVGGLLGAGMLAPLMSPLSAITDMLEVPMRILEGLLKGFIVISIRTLNWLWENRNKLLGLGIGTIIGAIGAGKLLSKMGLAGIGGGILAKIVASIKGVSLGGAIKSALGKLIAGVGVTGIGTTIKSALGKLIAGVGVTGIGATIKSALGWLIKGVTGLGTIIKVGIGKLIAGVTGLGTIIKIGIGKLFSGISGFASWFKGIIKGLFTGGAGAVKGLLAGGAGAVAGAVGKGAAGIGGGTLAGLGVGAAGIGASAGMFLGVATADDPEAKARAVNEELKEMIGYSPTDLKRNIDGVAESFGNALSKVNPLNMILFSNSLFPNLLSSNKGIPAVVKQINVNWIPAIQKTIKWTQELDNSLDRATRDRTITITKRIRTVGGGSSHESSRR